jgi:prevent-host-death family protein
MRFVSATELRDRLREHILRLGSDPIVIARHGRAVAVMVSMDAWNRMQDELDDLHDEIETLERLMMSHGLDRTEAAPPPGSTA